MEKTKDVLIVGGGLAGLCCARTLDRHNIPFTLFEGSDNVGGRVRTDLLDGFILDRGFQIFLTAYPEAKEVLDYASLDFRPFLPGALVRLDGKFHELSDPLRRPGKILETAFAPVGTMADKMKVGLMKQRSMSTATMLREPGTAGKTTKEVLEQSGFSESMIMTFFRPFLGGIFLESELSTSASMFEFLFKMLSTGENVLPARGMQSIPEQLAGALPPEKIRLSQPVTRVEGRSITLASGETIEGSAVVIATEEPQARRLLGQWSLSAFRSQTCLYYAATEAPIDEPLLIIDGESGGPVNNFCVPSQVAKTYAPPGRALCSASVIGDPQMSGTELDELVRRQLGQWFGRQVKSWELLRIYRVKYSLPDQSPGAVAAVDHTYQSADGIYLCGDYKDTGSINGAMRSGRLAGEAVISALSGP
jgi:phytoene dehydrogenase-like protein